MEPITSIDNPGVRQLGRLLDDAKERRARGLAVAEGPHLLAEATRVGRLRELWATPEALQSREGAQLLQDAAGRQVKPRLLSANLVKRLSQLPAPQGWLAVIDSSPLPWPPAATLSLALDGVQDPGNLGTLLRSAWAAQATLILGPGCADPWSPKVLRAGAGAQFHTPVQTVDDLALRLRELGTQGVQVLAAMPRAAQGYWSAPLNRPSCLVLGAEGPGLSEPVAAACPASLSVPYPGGAESLNVAVTGALLLFEALRQRQKP